MPVTCSYVYHSRCSVLLGHGMSLPPLPPFEYCSYYCVKCDNGATKWGRARALTDFKMQSTTSGQAGQSCTFFSPFCLGSDLSAGIISGGPILSKYRHLARPQVSAGSHDGEVVATHYVHTSVWLGWNGVVDKTNEVVGRGLSVGLFESLCR